jgi:hypothetical protein
MDICVLKYWVSATQGSFQHINNFIRTLVPLLGGRGGNFISKLCCYNVPFHTTKKKEAENMCETTVSAPVVCTNNLT